MIASEAENNASRPGGQLVPNAQTGRDLRDPYGALGRYPAFETSDLATTLREYFRIFNKRKWLILSIAGACLAAGALKTLIQTPLYTSTVRLQIDRNVTKVMEGGNVTPVEGQDLEFIKTQYELLESRNLAERVVSAVRLTQDPTFLKSESSFLGPIKRLFGTAPEKTDLRSVQKRAISIVTDNRTVKPVPGSRLVDLTYSDPSPERAQKIAAAYAQAFIASTLDKRFEANAYAKTFLEDQIKQLKLRLEDSEKAMLAFADKEQIVSINEKSSVLENLFETANTALGAVVTERIKNEQQWKQVANADQINLPQLLSNDTIEGLRTKRNDLVSDYQQKLQTYKPDYPAMLEIKKRITEIDRQLTNEVKAIRASLKAAYEASLAQENEQKARIEGLRNEVLDLQKRSIQYNILKREVDSNTQLYNGLLQRFKEVDVAGGVQANNVFVVDKPDLPDAPSSPRIALSLALSLIIGLGLGAATAYVLENFDDVITSVEEIERLVNIPALGVIPLASDEMGAEADLGDPRSALSEAYRSLCTSLQFTTESGLPKSLLVTSAGPGEGKSITSIAIARHFARLGVKVLLVDADMRNPSLHKKLKTENATGLSSYLTGACQPPDAFQITELPNLAFMSSGPLPPNAADLLSGTRLMSLISIGLEVFDLIVIDGPPVLGLADAPILTNATEATLFVVAAGMARTGPVRGALQRLEIAKAPLIGAVLTKYNARKDGYGYGYGYSYGQNAFSYGAVPISQPAQLAPSAEHRS